MNPVAAGGVYFVRNVGGTWTETTRASYNDYPGIKRAYALASDLEACQQLAQVRLRHLEAAAEKVAAAQAEADRLRKLVGKELRWRLEDIRERLMVYGIGGDRLYGIDEWSEPAVNLQLAIDLIDTAINSAKTEQERGE